tara:strand:+ start:1576 stop:2319 length:744 start_codon:yes stop_codon:yes gene_type:complete
LINKIVSSGCSFTHPFIGNTWAEYLAKHLDVELISTASSSQGNNLIARRVIHAVEECRQSDELLVAVQWSAQNRFARFLSEPQIELWEIENKHHTMIAQNTGNPIKIFKDDGSGSWLLSNYNWPDSVSENHMQFSDPIDELIRTYEDILRVENYLKRHKINYFMFLGWDDCLSKQHLQNKNVKYLHDMVDHTKWVDSEYQWCSDNTGLDFCEGLPPKSTTSQHPTPTQHKMYTEGAIIPHLKSRGLI